MSASVQTARVGTYRTRVGKPPVAASVIVAMLAAFVVAGVFTISATSSGSSACIPRVGCERASEAGIGADTASFAAVGPAGASATWFEMAVEPASPALEHFLHPGGPALGLWAFEPVSPALEHFLH